MSTAWLAAIPITAGFGQSNSLTGTSFAGLGLVDMPSARMAPDGALSIGADYFLNTQRYDLGFQALPWLNVRFEYSGLDHFDPQFPVYWDRSFGAKIRLLNEGTVLPAVSVGVTDVVGTGLFSGEYVVASKQFGSIDTSLGLGWGSLGSTDLFRNPFIQISHSFANRSIGLAAGGTDFNVFFHGPGVGLFGGAIWHTPIDGLSLTAEYSSNTYALQRERGNFTPLNQVNYAITYELNDTSAVSLAWLYGRSIGGEISFQLDPTKNPPAAIGPPLPPPPPVRTPKERQAALELMLSRRHSSPKAAGPSAGMLVDALWRTNPNLTDISVRGEELSFSIANGNILAVCRDAAKVIGGYSLTLKTVRVENGGMQTRCPVARQPALVLLANSGPLQIPEQSFAPSGRLITIDAIGEPQPDVKNAIAHFRADVAKQDLTMAAVNISGAEATIYYTNERYFSESDALKRLIRLAMADLPPEIEQFHFIASVGNVPIREFDVLRAPAERSFEQTGSLGFANNVTSRPAPMQNPVLREAERGSYPRFDWSIFPQFRQELFDPSNPLGVQFVGAAAGTAELFPGFSLNGEVEANIWNDFNTARGSDSVLPHVRTDFVQYFTKGKNGIGDLEVDYMFRLAPDVVALAKAGYLESMFAGAGGEVLWRPEGQRWALGGDLYEVQQRNFDRLFGLQNYRALTGHISLYYASPWYGLNFTVRAGQYLAQDRGFTIEVSRRFSTGVEVGAFFTKTNVSAARFGEGSFDKGIMLTIPIGWALPVDTQNELNTVLRPVQRDGGQRLGGDAVLYDVTRRTSESEIYLEENGPDRLN